MPNPIFEVSVSCDQGFGFLNVVGHCIVTIQNLGKINSQFTSARVLLYPICEGEYPENPANQLSLDFGTISPGESVPINTKDLYGDVDDGFNFGCETDAVVIVKDGWKYTPEKTEVIGMESALLTQWVVEAKNACFVNPEQCANVAGVFVGTTIKAAGYGGSSN